MRTLTFPLLLLLACFTAVAAWAEPLGPPLGPDDREAIARNGFPAEDIGYVLFDLDSQTTVAERQGGKAFVPASVAKLPTMAAALAVLGPDHRFDTTLHATGTLTDGVLDGDLILKGGGDPSLATEGLMDLVAELRTMGIARVTGRFLYDTSALPELPEIDSGQPWTAGYNTGVGALSVNFNRFQLAWTGNGAGNKGPSNKGTGKAKQPVQISAWSVSDAGRVPLDSVAVEVMAGEATPFTPVSASDGERWRFAPRPGVAASVWLPVTRPGLAAAHVFRRMAAESGIALPAPTAGTVPSTATSAATLVALHRSEPLAVLARQVLRYSNNLSAELIGLTAARRLDPTVRTLTQSAAVLTTASIVSGPKVDWSGLRLVNHSGLSTASRITPSQMAALLRAAGPDVWALLPGEDEGKVLPAGVHAKSGTMAYAKALAGTLTTAGGRHLGFAFFVTDEAQRSAMDAAMDRRVAELPPEARAWLVRARKLQADLLALWIAQL